jgi:hypothetical protein
MASKFQEFLSSQKIDPRRVLVASRAIERLRPEDRAIRRQKPAAEGEAGAEKKKPRSGRPVTPRLLESAIQGKSVSGPAKQRLLRAVNRILEQKKKDSAEFRALF